MKMDTHMSREHIASFPPDGALALSILFHVVVPKK